MFPGVMRCGVGDGDANTGLKVSLGAANFIEEVPAFLRITEGQRE